MMKKTFIYIAAYLFILSACVNSANKSEEVRQTESLQRKAIASLDGETLYQDEFFDFAASTIKEMDKDSYNNLAIKDQIFRDFMEHKILLSEAQKRGVTVDKKRINNVIDTFRSAEGSQDLKVYSGSYTTDQNKFAKLLEERVLIETLLNQVVNTNIVITEAQMQEYYKKHPEVSRTGTKAHIYHIFSKDKSVAEKAMDEIQKGLSFSEVAERYSEGPEKSHGGDLGLVSDKDFPEIFSEAFKLREGKPSQIIKSDYGFHIFLVKKYERAKTINYADAKSRIYYELYGSAQEKKTREFIDGLYNKADIKVLNDIDFNDFIPYSAR